MGLGSSAGGDGEEGAISSSILCVCGSHAQFQRLHIHILISPERSPVIVIVACSRHVMLRGNSRGADSQFKLSDAEKAEANALVAKTADELKAMYVPFPC